MSPINSAYHYSGNRVVGGLLSGVLLAFAAPGQAELLRPYGFPTAAVWRTDFSYGGEVPGVGDFNGDGLDDVATFYGNVYGTGTLQGDVMVALNGGGQFGVPAKWHDYFGIAGETVRIGDFNGDGMDDIVTFLHGAGPGAVFLATSNGSGFDAAAFWGDGIVVDPQVPLIGDFDGDGLDDVAAINFSTLQLEVWRSTGGGFDAAGGWLDVSTVDEGNGAFVGDFDGDGLEDIGYVEPTTVPFGRVMVCRSLGDSFEAPVQWNEEVLYTTGSEVFAGNFNGDAYADLALISNAGALWVALSDGTTFVYDPTSVVWHHRIRNSSQACLPGQFNSDLNDDLAVFSADPANGEVRVSLAGDHAKPSDIDLAVFGYGSMGVPEGVFPAMPERAAVTEIPLLLILIEFGDQQPFGGDLGRTQDFFANLFFGPGKPNLIDWFVEMSSGRFTFTPAGTVFIQPPAVLSREDIMQAVADAGFDFRLFDINGSGIIEPNELVIAGVDNFGTGSGVTGGVGVTVTYPEGPAITLSTRYAANDHAGPVDLYAHEVSHLIQSGDLYSSGCYNRQSTLMHCNAGNTVESSLVHLDAWHKMRFGWVEPVVYDLRDGAGYLLLGAPVLPDARPLLLYDSANGTDEYYLLEFRSPLSTAGDQVWDGQDVDLYKIRTPPGGVHSPAGYDSDVMQMGVYPWYVQMADPGNVLKENIGIKPRGEDNELDSVVLGDDVVTGNTIRWGPDRILQSVLARGILPGADGMLQSTASGDDIAYSNRIHPGPNAIIDSALAGDDTIGDLDHWIEDIMVMLSRDPWDLAQRGSADNILISGYANLDWRAAGKRPELYLEGVSDSEGLLSWGTPFRPFIQVYPQSEVVAGSTITLQGKLGTSGNYHAILQCNQTGQTQFLTVSLSTDSVMLCGLSQYTAAGAYTLYLKPVADTSSFVSNAVPIMVMDSYLAWLRAHFSEAEIADPLVTGEDVDIDGDGLTTVDEYALDRDPRTCDPASLQPFQENYVNSYGTYVVNYFAPFNQLTPQVDTILWRSFDLESWVTTSRRIGSGPASHPELATFWASYNLSPAVPKVFYKREFRLIRK